MEVSDVTLRDPSAPLGMTANLCLHDPPLTVTRRRITKPLSRSFMRFTDKLKKLADGRAFGSAMHRLRRIFTRRRSPVPLDVDEIVKTIDQQRFGQIRARYGMEDPGQEPPKYLELPRWIEANLKRIRDLELDLGGRKRVLDIGSGTGYFLYICGLLGHDAVGIDLDETPMFNESIELLGVDRRVWRVQPFIPLPDLGVNFDVITAHMICFNGHKSEALWATREWAFFLDDLGARLKRGGKIWLEFNREFDGTCYPPELKDYFESRGADVSSNRVVFNSGLRATA